MLCVVWDAGRLHAQEMLPEFLMMSDPAFDIPAGAAVLPQSAIRLWRETLSRPEPDLVKAAADSIAAAHSDGFSGLADCVPELHAALMTPDLHPDAAYAICRALIVLESRESAELLCSFSQREGTLVRQLIEPALASWDVLAMRDEWRNRLADEQALRRELLLACAGAARVKDAAAVPLLVQIAITRTRPADVRLAAARAAGEIAASGLEPDATRLTGNSSRGLSDDLCALFLLRHHTSAGAQTQFLQFAVHRNPTVAAPALRALLEIDASLVLPLAATALENDDPKVRQCGLDAYIALPTAERIPLIAAVLDDPHPDVRTSARRALDRFGESGMFDGPVREAGMHALSGESWRSQEQAALLLAARDHQPAAARLVELLESDRPEVMIAAAWALRLLAVPQTADGILDRASRMTEHVLAAPAADRRPGSDAQLGHLFDALVVLGDSRAVPVMRRHVRRDLTRETSRSAAIWGMGRLLEDQPDEELAAALLGRIQDINSIPPELELVRRMSAVTIGRMNAVSRLKDLEAALDQYMVANQVDYALAWAIRRMHGVVPPELPPTIEIRRGWPIEPAPSREDR